MKDTYDDIIDMPHHVSSTHPPMSMYNRAAQFAPFAALTGHDSAIRETARQTDEYQELSETEAAALDRKFDSLIRSQAKNLIVTVTYFIPDERKKGGHYQTITGELKKISPDEGLLELSDRTVIPIDRIKDIDREP